jgi:biotin carboxyl carrier protein
MKRELIVNGKSQSIEVRQEDGCIHFSLPDCSGSASIVEVEPGVYSVLLDGVSYLAQAVRNETSIAVEVRGHVYEIEIVDPRAPRRKTGALAGEGRQTIVAPMPGKIVRVLVREGDAVEPGQGIVVMEAMKMQNELKALRAGAVTALPVAEGAAVGAGEVLAIIE